MENTKESNTKIAFSVSKKVLKTAVSRNKYRRRGYSLIKKYINLIKPNLFLFFVFKKTNKLPDYQEMDLELNKLLSDSGVLL